MANKLYITKKNKVIKLKEKLQRSLQLGKRLPSWSSTTTSSDVDEHDEERWFEENGSISVPEDVKEGHFAVVVVDDDCGVAKRFVVPLRYLTDPMFLALLERTAEEYGFDHRGALTIPCQLSEMERILADK